MTGTPGTNGGLEFALPAKAWSTNEDRNLHHLARADLVKEWKDATIIHYRKAYAKTKPAWPPSIVQITIPFRDRRRRDPHNYCGTVLKAVIDGLVKAGAWPDDTPEYIGHREPRIVVDKQQQLVTVQWWPMEPTTEEEPQHG
jgi:Holliday junction resolvase RusA-like endonuclease